MMNNELKPYLEYKDTGVFWLDKIPSHWKWQFLSQACKDKCNKNAMDLEKNVLSLSYGQVIRKKNIDSGLVPKEYSTYQIVENGNIILRLTDLQNDKRSLRTGLVKERGIITSAYTCLYSRNNCPDYIHYLLHSYDLQKVFYGLGGGVRQSIGYEEIRKMKLPIPPRPEQDQIVKYLDHQLFKINKFIKAKKKLIAVLKEQKQAIINEAVTKGIDPSVKMKPSGIMWLGDVPEHWECKRIKSILNNINENTNENTGKQYIGMENVESWSGKVINLNPNFKFESQAKKFNNGDVLFGKLRPYLAKVATTDFSGVCSGEFLVLRPIQESILSKYLENVLRSKKVIDLIASSTFGAKMPRAEWSFIGNIKMFIPPTLNEQLRIFERLNFIQSSVDVSIAKIENEIQLISEYKNSLISDIVSGKIDVQNTVIDETEEIDLEDFVVDEDSLDTEELLEDEEGDE